jgi:hypothetical protein
MATAADLKKKLESLGLGFLYNLLETKLLPDATIDIKDTDQIAAAIEADPATKQAYDNRFIGNQLRVTNGMAPLKPSEYIRAEQEYISTLRATGLPLGFYDQQADLARFIGSDISVRELENRIVGGYRAAQQADAATKQQLEQLYGITEADLASYYLDPTKATDVLNRKKDATLFQQQIGAAGIAGQARTQANIALTAQQAEELQSQGVTAAAARQGFGAISQQQGLFEAQMAGETAVSQEEQIGAALGTNAQAAQRIATRRRRRQAEFEAGGSFAAGQRGVAGLGTANQ